MPDPVLLSLTLTDSVDVEQAPFLNIKAEAMDSDGVEGVHIYWTKGLSYSVNGYQDYVTYTTVRGGSDWTSGSRSTQLQLLNINDPGTYTIREVSIMDRLNNSTTYSLVDLARLGFDTSFTLTGVTADRSKPTLTSLKFPSVIDTSKGPVQWTVTTGATDTLSDIFEVNVEFARPLRGTAALHSTRPAAGDYVDVPWLSIFSTPEAFKAGTAEYSIWVAAPNGVYNIDGIRVTDKAANVRYYDAAEMHKLGMTNQIVVSDGTYVAPKMSATLRTEAAAPGQDGTLVLKLGSTVIKGESSVVKFTVRYNPTEAHFDGWAGSGKGAFSGETNTIELGTYGEASFTGTIESSGADSGIEMRFKSVAAKGNFSYDITDIAVGRETLLNSFDQRLPYRIQTLRDGTAGSDRLSGDDRDELFQGGAGNDVMRGEGGRDELHGGVGTDTAQYAKVRALYKVERSGTDLVVSDLNASEDVDRLHSVEILQFADISVTFDPSGDAAAVYRLYKAAFDRAPDASGFGFWVHAREAGVSLHDIAAGFVASKEFATLYGATASNASIVKGFYQNVLDRQPDAGGTAFWLDVLERKAADVADVLTGFSDSAENQAALATLIGQGMSYIPYG